MLRCRTLVLPLSLALALGALTATPAQAADTGSITGTLLAKPTGGTAAPYPSGGVQVYYSETEESVDSTVVAPSADVEEDGTFTISGLKDGWYWLRGYGGDYATEFYPNSLDLSAATSFRVAGGAIAVPEPIVLEAPGAVTGRVVDRSGRPIADASVGFLTSDTSGGHSASTGPDGRFDTRGDQWLELVAGTYVMEISAWGQDLSEPVYRTSRVEITVGPDQVLTENVVLDERPSAVFTVLDPDGQPLVAAPLRIQVRDEELFDGEWAPIQSGPHETDESGRYRFVDGFDEVRFEVRPPVGYGEPAVAEWWDDAASFDDARTLSFPADTPLRRDFTIQLDEAPVAPGQPTTPTTPPPAPTVGTLTGSRPKVQGRAALGRTLRAKVGSWAPGPVRLTYTWFRGAKPVARATKASYRLTRRDLGARISVRVTGSRSGFTSLTVRSPRTAKVTR